MFEDDDEFGFLNNKLNNVVRKSSDIFDYVYHRNLPAFQECLDAGVSVDVVRAGNTLLNVVVSQDYEPALDILLNNGVNLNTPSEDQFNASILSIALIENNDYLFTKLLNAGADPNLEDSRGISPLLQAVSLRKEDLVLQLLEKNIYLNTVSEKNETALTKAISLGMEQTVEVLLEKGALLVVKGASAIKTAEEFNPHFLPLLKKYETTPDVSSKPDALISEVIVPSEVQETIEEPALVSTISRRKR